MKSTSICRSDLIRLLAGVALTAGVLAPLAACQSDPAVTSGRPSGYGAMSGRRAPEAPVRSAFEWLDDDAREFHQHVTALSDPFFEGRRPGTAGAEHAARYLRYHLNAAGLNPLFGTADSSAEELPLKDRVAFFQSFEVQGEVVVTAADVIASTGADELVFAIKDDFNPLGASASDSVFGELVFVGYGISDGAEGYTSFSGDADLTGKIALLLRFEPMDTDGQSLWGESGAWSAAAGLSAKIQNVIDHGAAGVILVNPPGADDPRASRLPTTAGTRFREQLAVPAIALSTASAEALVAMADHDGRSLQDLRELADADSHEPVTLTEGEITLDIAIESAINNAQNVGAILPGRGALADEYVIIGAHFDHLGYGGEGSLSPSRFGEVHAGADDNASGTAGVLLAARNLKARYDDLGGADEARSILFLLFSGEEMGLLGSKHYVDALEGDTAHISAMLNMDMIGRLRKNSLELFGTGTSSDWDELLTSPLRDAGFAVKTAPQGEGPSDHASFYRVDIPVLAFFTGLHRQYHTPDDLFPRINSQGGARIADLVSDVAFEIAMRPESLAFTSTDSERPESTRRAAARVRLGVMPGSYDQTERGLLVGDVISGGAADQAGILAEDRIVGWNGEELVNVFSYMEALSGHKPGDVITLTIERDGATIQTQVTLEAWREGE